MFVPYRAHLPHPFLGPRLPGAHGANVVLMGRDEPVQGDEHLLWIMWHGSGEGRLLKVGRWIRASGSSHSALQGGLRNSLGPP